MKYLKIKLLILLLCLFAASYGQNFPWKKYGLNPKVMTLSNGKYKEFHDMETVVQIGSVYLNTKTHKIVGFVKKDTTSKVMNIDAHTVSRWMSPDPLSEEYSSWSPYNYVMNNPIIFIDPDGRSSSPYYDKNGDFLGVDENGFEGDIYITDAETFNKKSKKGVANSKSIQKDKSTTKIDETSVNKLSNGACLKIYTHTLTERGYSNFTLTEKNTGFLATTRNTVPSNILINFGYDKTRRILSTVENVENAIGVHEFNGHAVHGYSKRLKTHHKAYELQFKHGSWKNTTSDFKDRSFRAYVQLFSVGEGRGPERPGTFYGNMYKNKKSTLWKDFYNKYK